MSSSPSRGSESTKQSWPKVKSHLSEELLMEQTPGPEDSKAMGNTGFSSTLLAYLSGF